MQVSDRRGKCKIGLRQLSRTTHTFSKKFLLPWIKWVYVMYASMYDSVWLRLFQFVFACLSLSQSASVGWLQGLHVLRCLSLSQSVSVCIGLTCSVSVCFCLCQSITVCSSLSQSVSVRLSSSQSVSACLSLCQSILICIRLTLSLSRFVAPVSVCIRLSRNIALNPNHWLHKSAIWLNLDPKIFVFIKWTGNFGPLNNFGGKQIWPCARPNNICY